MSSPVMWISQVRGANKIRLTPRRPCDVACSTLYAVLHEGETGQCTSLPISRIVLLKPHGVRE